MGNEFFKNPLVLAYVVFTLLSSIADLIQVGWALKGLRTKKEEELKKRHIQEFLYEQSQLKGEK